MGQLEASDAIGHGARESAFAVTKQFTFEQIFGNGGAIDGDKISATSVGLVVQCTRHQLFARTAFASDQDRGVGRSNPFDQVPNGFGASAGANESFGKTLFSHEGATGWSENFSRHHCIAIWPQKHRNVGKPSHRHRLFATSRMASPQASQVDAESEGDGLRVPPLTRN